MPDEAFTTTWFKPLPSIEYLCECFDYDPDMGLLMWRRRPRRHFKTARAWAVWNTRFAGMEAGRVVKSGHRSLVLDYITYKTHRIIFKLMTGMEPPETIDHIDGDGANNRWINLRPATKLEQQWNRIERKHNTSGYRGVSPSLEKWQSRIRDNGAVHYLGTFDTPEEASAAYEAAARELHGEFYRKPDKGE